MERSFAPKDNSSPQPEEQAWLIWRIATDPCPDQGF
jgi:hypothetical protein